MKVSLEARLAALVAGIVLATLALVAAASPLFESTIVAALATLPIAMLLALALLRLLTQPMNRLIGVLADGIRGLREGDFSLSIAADRSDELGELVKLYNTVGEILRRERQNLYQRELLLDTVIQSTPLALVLTDPGGRVIYTNAAARQQFGGAGKIEGRKLADVVAAAPAALREAVLSGQDRLVTVGENGETEVFQVSHNGFALNTQPHDLYLIQRLTRELTRQELATWKKVIRVISHELNNSLAPISSLAHSARTLAARGENDRLDGALSAIGERAARLKQFLDGYASFAKLPLPRPELIEWSGFLDRLRSATSFKLEGAAPTLAVSFDAGQMQQVLINLIKNAHESGSGGDDVALRIDAVAGGMQLRVLDRGTGMSEAVLKNALLPFYTTKPSGTGLGLALCREIVEAHGGRLALENRDGGGLEVRIWLPATCAS
ncbi:MAG TPA: ATP-binding protein [Nevskiaceae bacterium]|nr:ATP-binding protein [Nevskiaceae bacterium]